MNKFGFVAINLLKGWIKPGQSDSSELYAGISGEIDCSIQLRIHLLLLRGITHRHIECRELSIEGVPWILLCLRPCWTAVSGFQ